MQTELVQTLLLVILLLGFLFTISNNYKAVIQLYIFQTIAIFAILIVTAGMSMVTDLFLLLSTVVGVAIRIFFIPMLIFHFLKKEHFHLIERDFKIPVFGSLLIELIVFLFTYALCRRIFPEIDIMYLVSLMLVSFGFITSFNHRKLFSNILGLLMIENAILLLSISLLGGIPFFMELGILVNVFVSLFVALVALIKIKSIDTKMSVESIQDLKEVF